MIGPKIPAISASVGFILSFITGIISGIAPGVSFFRALLMGLLFGTAAVLIHFLVSRYLPELLIIDASGDANEDSATGGIVNITIDDPEGPIVSYTGTSPSDDSGSPDLMPDFFEKPVESDTLRDVRSGGAIQDGSSSGFPFSGEGESGGTASGSVKNASAPPASKPAHRNAVSGLDVLPDLEDFIPEVKVQETEEDELLTGGSAPEGGFSSFRDSEVKTGGMETETMAKAIRTILSRDSG
jgi:hypothetical protein